MRQTIIYQYDDFRMFLKACFEERKTLHPKYSQRKFAKEAGFSNPGLFNDIIKGHRKLSKSACEKMIAVFSLNAAEEEYFRLLVRYRQAKSDQEKENVYRQIAFRRSRSSFNKVNPAATKYYQDYRYPLIRTALMAKDFFGDYETLSRFVYPSIPAGEIKKCIRDLCEWGLVFQNSSGKYCVSDRFVEPEPHLKENLKRLNREWISHASQALMTLPPEKRHMSSMLVSVSPETAKEIHDTIEKTREHIWDLVKNDPHTASTIMQLNIQYFPRSKNGERSW